jgi:AcrR family transcriptional regulator
MGSNGTKADDIDGERLPRIFDRLTQRERLLDGIAQTVAREGYAATSVASVLEVAGVSRRTFYELFADKEDCFLAAYDAIVFSCTERVATAYHAGSNWEDAIARAFRTLLETLAAEPDFGHLGVVDVLGAGPQALARRDATLRRFARFIDFTRERSQASVAPPAFVGQAIVGGIHELVYSRIVQGKTTRLPELTPELLHYTFMLLGVPGQTG